MGRVSKIFRIFVAMFFVLILGNGCQDNREAQPPASPNITGDFPLKEYWKKNFDGDIKAMSVWENSLVVGIAENDRAVIQVFYVDTGTSRWKSKIPTKSTGMDLTVFENVVYAICDSRLLALDMDTGNIIFQTDIGASIGDEIVAISNERVFVYQISEGVYAYDRGTGKRSWDLPLGRGHVDVFLNTTDGLVYIVHGEYLKAFHEQNGDFAWESKIGLHGAANYQADILYFATSQVRDEPKDNIHAFSLKENGELWKTKLASEVDCLMTNGNGLIAITTKTIALIDSKSGNRRWEYHIPLGVYSPPILSDGVIYLKDGSNDQVIAMKEENGGLQIIGRLDFEDSNWLGYQTPTDNLLVSAAPFPYIAFYLGNSLFVFK